MPKAPLSPNDCREHAHKCLRLLRHAQAPRLKQALRERAAILLKLAIELERSEALRADIPTLPPGPGPKAK